MHKKRLRRALILAGAAVGVALGASAEGIGSDGTHAVMGQALDFSVLVRVAPGETLDPACVSSQVTLGERALPQAQVRTAVQMEGADLARIHVLTLQPVDEPVVGVVVNAGCASRLTRRFVVLADPPLPAATPAPLAALPLAVATSGTTPGAAATSPPDLGTTRAPAAAVAGSERGGAGIASADRPAQRATPTRAARPPLHRATRHPRRTDDAATPRLAAATPPAPSGPRLHLDLAEPVPDLPADLAIEQALEAVAEAASATRAAAATASAAAGRVAELEHRVARLQEEVASNDRLNVQLDKRLQRARADSRWTWPLLVTTLLLTALSGWLGWRMAALQQQRQGDWRRAAAAVPPGASPSGSGRQATAPIPFVTSEIAASRRQGRSWPPPDNSQLTQPASVVVALAPGPRVPAPAPPAPARQPPPSVPRRAEAVAAPAKEPKPEPESQRTVVLQPAAAPAEAEPRDVSIDELIDLEQQAEFFIVLGQEEAAIDLLVEHLRNTGGGSPLPYLKLLEIYGRRGDRAAYERVRSRFNHRFNAYAPEWGVDLQAGRSLPDYGGILPRLEQVWKRPLDAMAELEALMFRKSRGDLFELPAYREVLFLYAVARDLLDREAGVSGSVDLLLPLARGGDFSTTAPAPYLELGQEIGGLGAEHDDHPTSPVDLDLSAEEARKTSIFDVLGDRRPPPRAG